MNKIYSILKLNKLRSLFLLGAMFSFLFAYPQVVYEFTNAGAKGMTGPTQADLNSAYSSTNLAGQVTSNNGIQEWVVPASGIYRIKAIGAQGGWEGGLYGQGAIIEADMMLIGGTTLKILVGQAGGYYTNRNPGGSGGGGGGSYVTTSLNEPLVIAGGGGGEYDGSSPQYTTFGSTKTKGEDNGCGSGGSNGNGGNGCTGSGASGGGGLKTDGTKGTYGYPGEAFINGGKGGDQSSQPEAIGGFGGGGGTHGNTGGGGGGGGYSGGAGGYHSAADGSGGGGGSYVSPTATQLNTSDGKYDGNATFNGVAIGNLAGFNKGHGKVVITVISVGEADVEAVSVRPLSKNPSLLCVKTPYDFEITLTNNGPDDASFIDFEVSVPGMKTLKFEFFDIMDLQAGMTKTYKISDPDQQIIMPNVGNRGITLNITKVLSDGDVIGNNKVTTNYMVSSLPYGTEFTPDAGFPGFPSAGSGGQDLLTHDKIYRYKFTAPAGYNNTGYGTAWKTSFYGVMENEPLPGNRYTLVPPMGGNDGYLELQFKPEDIDKNASLFFTVTDLSNALCDSLIKREIHIAPMPSVDYQDVGGCLGTTLQFVNLSEIASGTIPSIFWDFGDGTTSDLFAPQKAFNTKGIYNVKLVVTSDLGFSDSMIKTIDVIETPDAAFSFENTCGNTPFEFNNESTISVNSSLTYRWDFGDDESSTDENPLHLYENPGPYNVTLTAIAENGCETSITKAIYSYPGPVADFDMPEKLCVGTDLDFVNKTSIPFSTWGSEWRFGENNNRSFKKDVTYKYTSSGEKTLKLIVTTQFGCVDSVVKVINVEAGPNINITHSDACMNTPVIFNSNVEFPEDMKVEYIWNINGSLYPQANPVVSFATSENKNVSVDITYANGCKSMEKTIVGVGHKPNAEFSIDDAVCSDVELNIHNQTTIDFGEAEYFWDLGDGMISNEFVPEHSYHFSTPTTLNITLIASSENGICPDTAIRTVTVGQLPSCEFDVDAEYVPGHRGYQFSPEHAGASYFWTFGDGYNSEDMSPIHQYTKDGNYKVTLVVTTDEGCACEKTINHNVYNLSSKQVNGDLGFKVYPSPSTGILTIDNPELTEVKSIKVTNIIGETVLERNVNQGFDRTTIDLNNVVDGVYLVSIEAMNGQQFITKVIIAK